jgi:hypothetical protein
LDTYLNGVGSMTGSEYVGCTTGTDADCVTFLDAIFSSGDFGAEANVGTEPDPGDQRRDALDSATYFANACPAEAGGCTWDTTDVFQMIP